MSIKPKPIILTANELNELLIYNKNTGNLIYKERPLEMFSNNIGAWSRFNKNYVGKIAGSIGINRKDNYKYISITIHGKKYRAHRIIWKLVTGEEPPEFIDHIDQDATNNKWNNLRPATYSINNRNKFLQKNNTSGVAGVSWNKTHQKWLVRINDNEGKRKHLGYFEDFEEAIVIRKSAESKYDYFDTSLQKMVNHRSY